MMPRAILGGRRMGTATMFIQTEETPNPATLKFIPGRTVLPEGTRDFRDPDEAQVSPLAGRIFSIEGVTGVFLGHDFVTVTKDRAEWPHIKPAVLGAIMEHYLSGAPILAEGSSEDADDDNFDEADAETVAVIKDLIETRVRPAVANDGGDITFQGFRDGVVFLHMRGACSGCPSSTATLKQGIENLLRHFVPDVVEVRPGLTLPQPPALPLEGEGGLRSNPGEGDAGDWLQCQSRASPSSVRSADSFSRKGRSGRALFERLAVGEDLRPFQHAHRFAQARRPERVRLVERLHGIEAFGLDDPYPAGGRAVFRLQRPGRSDRGGVAGEEGEMIRHVLGALLGALRIVFELDDVKHSRTPSGAAQPGG